MIADKTGLLESVELAELRRQLAALQVEVREIAAQRDTFRARQTHLKPHVEAFLEWATVEFEKVKNVRGALRDALGYTVRQRGPLTAFLNDGRLEMTNNSSERELRLIAALHEAPQTRPRSVPARSHPRPAPLAQGQRPRAEPQVLGRDARPPQRQAARQ
ncbi:MAG: hypothetical protein EXR76_06640 [Myxococcales bacterium]|nr:hypothetical protein [Myxococcales bacterium]